MLERLKQNLQRLAAIKWATYILLSVVFINGLATFTDSLRKIGFFVADIQVWTKRSTLTDEQLKAQALDLSKALIQLSINSEHAEPAFDFSEFDRSAEHLLRHTEALQQAYDRDYATSVEAMRNEFFRRGIRDREFDLLYPHPTNSIGIRQIGIQLGEFATRLAAR